MNKSCKKEMYDIKDILSLNKEENNLTNFCRACLKNKNGMKFLLDNTEETNMLITKFVSVLHFELELKSEYPSYLCKVCEKKINTSYEFREQCKASNDLIYQYVLTLENHGSPSKNEDVSIVEDRESSEIYKNDSSDAMGVFKTPSSYICCHCNKLFTNKEGLEAHLSSHDKKFNFIENVKVENSLFHLDIQENTSIVDDKDINFPKETEVIELKAMPQRNSTNQKMRLKQYNIEDVDRVVKMVRAKLYQHITCIFCKFEATSSRTLSVHVTRVHREFKGQWCLTCNELFDNLIVHNRNIHYEDLKCPFCDKIQSNMGHFMEHMACHSGSRLHKCTICNKSYISARHLRSHQETHVGDPPFGCRICKKRFLQVKMLRAHFRVAHKRIDSENKEDLNIKDGSEDGSSDLTCIGDDKIIGNCEYELIEPQNYCRKCAKKVRSLTEHNRKCHSLINLEKEDKQNLCPHCGKRFRTQSKLTMHIRTHTGERPYKCQYCERRLKTRNILVLHERTHTGEKPYACTTCGKSFAQSSVLKTHQRIHTGRPEQCKICEKRFCRPAELRLHLRKHTGEKPFSCHVCNQAFKQKSHLVEHTKRHSNDRPYKCNFCERSFKNLGTLKCHLQIHTGDKPFKCSQCPYACRQAYSLTQHMQQHEEDRPQADHPHTCTICQRSFGTVAHLTTHYNRYHSHLNVKTVEKLDPESPSDEMTVPGIQFIEENVEFVDQPIILGESNQIHVAEQVTIHSELNQSIFEFTVIQ